MENVPPDMRDETSVAEEKQKIFESHIRAETQALRIVVMHQCLKYVDYEAEAIKLKGNISTARDIQGNDDETINKEAARHS